MPPLLSVTDLSVEYPVHGSLRRVVDSVSFDLAEGEAIAVVGESGCGKTALARALIGLSPEGARVSGSIALRGRELAGGSDRQWREVRGTGMAMVFQEPASALDPVATVGSQIVEAIGAHARVSRKKALARARELLSEVSFPDPGRGLAEYPHRLSGGQRQRVMIATALAANPAVLLADEPTTALDATIAAEVLELLDGLRRSRRLAMLLVTHDLASVADHTDRVLVFYAGRVVEHARTAELFAAPRHPYTRGLLACAPGLAGPAAEAGARFHAIPGAVPEPGAVASRGCAFAPRCSDRFDPCETSDPPLLPAGGGSARCFLYGPPA